MDEADQPNAPGVSNRSGDPTGAAASRIVKALSSPR